MEIIACEAFIRRAARIDGPFMLKGSFVGRHYFPSIDMRLPQDMDWVYTDSINNAHKAHDIFSEWAQAVTELRIDDGVRFTSFSKNPFWRYIDYAMADDFPTTNTDITCVVDGSRLALSFDVSFNLDLPVEPTPLLIQPVRGDPFVFPKTTPLSLQAAWKMHQTVVRPRMKDLYDLAHFLSHPAFDAAARWQALRAFADECRASDDSPAPLRHFISGEWERLFPADGGRQEFLQWKRENSGSWGRFLDYAQSAPDCPWLSRTQSDFENFKAFALDACRRANLSPLSEADLLSFRTHHKKHRK